VSIQSKQKLIQIIENVHSQGAEAALLGCTELGMLVSSENLDIPIYDTTFLHASEAVQWSLGIERN